MKCIRLARLADLFDEQYPDLPTGGFLNPELMSENATDMEFDCHYDNYENDPWTWYYHKPTGKFYN